MKKVFTLIATALVAHGAFAGYAWFSEPINAILAKMPSQYYTKLDATLWGSFNNNIWTPPYAAYNSVTMSFTLYNNSSFQVTSYAKLNEYGKYDVDASLNNFFDNCGEYITDEFGNPYTFYDDSVAVFYALYEGKNMDAARSAFNSLTATFTLWRNDVVSSTTTLETDVSKIAELTKEIDEKLGDAKAEIENTVAETQKTADRLNNQLTEVQESLTKISDEAVYNAQKKIETTVSDFNAFVSKLEIAITLEDWDDTAFESAFSELSQSEQDLIDAITALQGSSSDSEVAGAITVLNGQLTGIQSLKTSLRTAITNKDKTAASSVLASAKGMSFYNSRKSIAAVNNKIKSLKSKEKVLDLLVKASLATITSQNGFVGDIDSLRTAFSAMFITSMDNFHQINSYLGSTNSMMYLDKRREDEANSLADFTTDELERWVKISMQEPLFRDAKDKANYETIGRLGVFGGGTYDNILRFIGSTYFLMYQDSESLGRFANTYDQGSFDKNRIRGFYEQVTGEEDHPVTNWYANKITAPVNWADNSTIIVTNGKFKVTAANYPWAWSGTNHVNRTVQVGYSVTTVADASDGDGAYYVEYTYSSQAAEMKKAASVAAIPASDETKACMWVSTISGGKQTGCIATAPVIYMWWY